MRSVLARACVSEREEDESVRRAAHVGAGRQMHGKHTKLDAALILLGSHFVLILYIYMRRVYFVRRRCRWASFVEKSRLANKLPGGPLAIQLAMVSSGLAPHVCYR